MHKMCKILLQVRAAARVICLCMCATWRGSPHLWGKLLFQYCCQKKTELPTSFFFLTLPWMHLLRINTLLTHKKSVYADSSMTNHMWVVFSCSCSLHWCVDESHSARVHGGSHDRRLPFERGSNHKGKSAFCCNFYEEPCGLSCSRLLRDLPLMRCGHSFLTVFHELKLL